MTWRCAKLTLTLTWKTTWITLKSDQSDCAIVGWYINLLSDKTYSCISQPWTMVATIIAIHNIKYEDALTYCTYNIHAHRQALTFQTRQECKGWGCYMSPHWVATDIHCQFHFDRTETPNTLWGGNRGRKQVYSYSLDHEKYILRRW